MTLERFLGLASAILSIAFIWPQVWRSLRHNTTLGISPFGLIHGLFGATLWLSYGIGQSLAPVAIANVSFVTAQSLIILVATRNGHIPRRVVTGVYPVVLMALIVLPQVPGPVLGVMAVIISGSAIVPQFLHVLGTTDLHGISLFSYALTIVTCVAWLSYGFVLPDLMISAQNFVAIPILAYIMLKAWRHRRSDTVETATLAQSR